MLPGAHCGPPSPDEEDLAERLAEIRTRLAKTSGWPETKNRYVLMISARRSSYSLMNLQQGPVHMNFKAVLYDLLFRTK